MLEKMHVEEECLLQGGERRGFYRGNLQEEHPCSEKAIYKEILLKERAMCRGTMARLTGPIIKRGSMSEEALAIGVSTLTGGRVCIKEEEEALEEPIA